MKVAIMGAGISGLSCAITLEKNGIEPVIFEKRSRVGDRFINAEAMFSILNRPAKDCLKLIDEDYGIHLRPIDEVNKLFIHSKTEVSSINGNIGYTNIRGRHDDSYEHQLEKQIKSKINFNSKESYEDLCRTFDYVVLATGDGNYASSIGNYRSDLTCTIKGAIVEGDFQKDSCHVWFNYEIIPKGYAWLIPFNEKEGNLVIAFPEYPTNIKLSIKDTWKKFYSLACKDLQQNFKITDSFEVNNYIMGICNKPCIENTYFVGNCFGAISPGFGFGQFVSILTGIYTAYDICGLGDYEKLTKPLFDNYNSSLVLRKSLEKLDDDKLDNIIRSIDSKLLDKAIDKMFSNDKSMDLLGLLTPFMKINNKR